jgi:hypothetical protein
MESESRTTRTTIIDDDEDEVRDNMGNLPRTQRRLARGLLDASTELWAGGFRVFGSLLIDLGDSIARPGAGRARRGRTSADTGGTGMADNAGDMVESVLSSVSNSVSGAADTVQRSLNIVASAIAPEDAQSSADTSAEGARARRRSAETTTRTRVTATRESVEP